MKREFWGILLAFLGGIVLANLLGKELLTTYGILNDYYLSQYSYRVIDGNRLFCYVLTERCKAAFIIFLFGKVFDGKVFSIVMRTVVAATFGFLVVVAIVNLGMRGLIICIGGLFPQWIFYLAALFLYTNGRADEVRRGAAGMHLSDMTEGAARCILTLVAILLGIAAESYINPVLLGHILKIFS